MSVLDTQTLGQGYYRLGRVGYPGPHKGELFLELSNGATTVRLHPSRDDMVAFVNDLIAFIAEYPGPPPQIA